MVNKKKIRFHRCSKCNDMAKYLYVPSSNCRRYFCELHVPRGCSCNVDTINEWDDSLNGKNVIWWSKEEYEHLYMGDKHDLLMAGSLERRPDSFYFEVLDHNGMRNPCCEYDYSEDGFEIEENIYTISKDTVIDTVARLWTRNKHLPFTLKDKIMTNINKCDDSIRYDKFMRRIYNICYPYTKGFIMYSKDVQRFFNAFKSVCQEHKMIKE